MKKWIYASLAVLAVLGCEKVTPTETPETIHGVPSDTIVYVSEKSSTIHRIHDCSGMKNYREMTVAEADAKGYDYCPHCW